jgi:hypothetical protein
MQTVTTIGLDIAFIDPTFTFLNASDAALYEIDLSPGVINDEADTSVTPPGVWAGDHCSCPDGYSELDNSCVKAADPK